MFPEPSRRRITRWSGRKSRWPRPRLRTRTLTRQQNPRQAQRSNPHCTIKPAETKKASGENTGCLCEIFPARKRFLGHTYETMSNLKFTRYAQIVKARENGKPRAHRLRHPPEFPQQRIFAALHVVRHQIKDQRG